MPRDPAYDVVVIGAGPAGMAAAACAAESGRRVALVDENDDLGGQIWRRARGTHDDRQAAHWIRRVDESGTQRLGGARVVTASGGDAGRRVWAHTPKGPLCIDYESLILATGSRERFVPFPGWTLPGVVGVGGLQALVKCGLPVERRRIVIAGTGPLLPAVAGYVARRGADVLLVAEQASLASLARFSCKLLAHPAKLVQGARLKWAMHAPLKPACWPTRAEPDGQSLRVTLCRGRRTWNLSCDYLACGYGLVANAESAAMLGCNLQDRFVVVDAHQQTTVPGVYAVGELTGVGGVDAALVEGQIAGYAAAGRHELATPLLRRRDRWQGFAAAMEHAFALRPELSQLADDQTIICRCEDVPLGEINRLPDWRSAKLLTRCGMGPCQGRICGEATRLLLDFAPANVRPPIFPVPVAHFVEALPATQDRQP